jgi:hypothetical protein
MLMIASQFSDSCLRKNKAEVEEDKLFMAFNGY